MYATPRDTFTHAKLIRRNLFTAARNPDTNGLCMCCGQPENQIHLVKCDILQRIFWTPIKKFMVDVGFTLPTLGDEDLCALVTFRITDSTVMNKEQAGVTVIAWRCLYAEMVRARVEKVPFRPQRALKRTLTLLRSRITAYGHGWKEWSNTHLYTSSTCVVPPEIQEGLHLIRIGATGDYVIHSELDLMIACVSAQGPGLAFSSAPGDRAPPIVDVPKREHVETDLELEEWLMRWRDLSGDAVTQNDVDSGRARHAECNLSAARNLLRDETLERRYLRERQLGALDSDGRVDPDDPLGTRYPDWSRIMNERKGDGEYVVTVIYSRLTDVELLLHFDRGVVYTPSPPHVICIHKHDRFPEFRVFDNDSRERARGGHKVWKPSNFPSNSMWTGVTKTLGDKLALEGGVIVGDDEGTFVSLSS